MSDHHKLKLQQPKGRELLGGDLLAQCLKSLGVEVLFGLHGGHLDAFLMGCADMGIEIFDTRHETVAVQAAEGYAKVKGKTGVCFITANSGFCNGLPGLATALADRSPVFCVTSSAPLRDAATNALQDFHDQVVLAKPVTKFAHRVTNVGEIPRLVSLAWRTANTGAPGPVVIDFPIDVLFTPIIESTVAWGNITAPQVSLPGPDPKAVQEVVKLAKEAKRPVILVGTGARGAIDEISTFADKTGIPIFHSPKFSTGISHKHAYFGGAATLLALLAPTGKETPDLVILLGARTGFLLAGRSGAIIPNTNSKTIQVDVDGGEIGRSTHVDLGLVSDIALAVSAFTSAVESNSFKAPEDWVKTALSLKSFKAPHNESEPVIDTTNGNLHPYHAVKKLLSSAPEGHILVVDGGECGGWTLQLMSEAKSSLQMVATGYLGFLGNGWGYSLGAAVADRSKVVVNIQGDGSAGFHIAELDTFKKFGLKVVTVVVNNSVWGMSVAGQEMIYGKVTSQRPAAKLRVDTRYDIVAQGFACTGALIDATNSLKQVPSETRRKTYEGESAVDEANSGKVLDGIAAAVEDVLKQDGPGLIDLRVSPYPNQDTTKAMVGHTDDPNVIVVPYYDNIPRPYYK